jgi:hypothetical protein
MQVLRPSSRAFVAFSLLAISASAVNAEVVRISGSPTAANTTDLRRFPMWDPMWVSIGGDPETPAAIAINWPYEIAIGAFATNAPGNWEIIELRLYGASGNSGSPTSSWVLKGTKSIANLPGAIHPFNVVNQASGYYWWSGQATEKHKLNQSTQVGTSPVKGAYYTQ